MDTWYRVLFQGPSPHALVCAEKAVEQVVSAKKKAQRRLKDAQHDEYESIDAQVDQAMYGHHIRSRSVSNAHPLFSSRASKEAYRVKRLLEPGSDIHTKQSETQLKAAIEALGKLIQESTFIVPQS